MHLNLLTSLVLACHSESDLRDPFANFHSFAERIELDSMPAALAAGHFYAHRFRLPSPVENIVLCIPQKNGNRYFGALMHLLHFGGAPGSVDEMLQGMSRYDHTLVQETDRVWILARNPYSRILSLYLQKVANACKFGSLGCNDWEEQMKLASIMGYDASKPPSFPAFVELMAEMILRLQANGITACLLNKHFCSQTSGCAWREAKELLVLKLEQQWQWFWPLVRALGLTSEQLMGEAWRVFSGMPCLYGRNCTDRVAPTPPLVDRIHGTGASQLLAEHYTPRAAALVREIYKADFELLRYGELS
ncbi:unnamed protein product [Effrenium voratum]|uniref:Sulfotransferase n=1 Tax=Effrenium voratum TaxID=2562239 RepID=A0AA36MM93_9DINO|nr:unnamed protein product [Effrenium voratum]CAJ1461247.1 unnamed protein product [Effrenium voratum]